MAYEMGYKGEVKRNTSERFYRIWGNMKSRCQDRNNPSYRTYGARGIKLCDKWKDFIGFYEDMYETYKKSGLENPSIERINNKGNYEKSNCQWIELREQGNNRNRTKWITWEGRTLNLTQWAKELGVKRSTMMQRYIVYKWSVEKILTPTR